MAESGNPHRVIWQRRYLPSQAVLQSLLQPIDQDEPSQAVLQNLQGPPKASQCGHRSLRTALWTRCRRYSTRTQLILFLC